MTNKPDTLRVVFSPLRELQDENGRLRNDIIELRNELRDEVERLTLKNVLLSEELRNLKAVSVYVDPDAPTKEDHDD